MPKQTWTIGSDPSCDIVIENKTVSGKHCQLTVDGTQLTLTEFGSTNGTFVDGQRLQGSMVVSRASRITLGTSLAVPWPKSLQAVSSASSLPSAPAAEAPAKAQQVITLGRASDNTIVLTDSNVSQNHAQLIQSNEGMVLEDLGSTNGTSVGTVENKISRVGIRNNDTIFLGSTAYQVSALLALETANGIPIFATPIPTGASPEVLATVQAKHPKTPAALKAGLSGLARATSITNQQASQVVDARSDFDKRQELTVEVESAVTDLKADSGKFKIQLSIGVISIGLLAIGWLAFFQPWKSDLTRAQLWANRGSAKAQHRLAAMYDFGKDTERDIQAALKWYTRAAESGFVDSQFNLGNMYLNREGVPHDYEAAFGWFQKAAEQGDSEAQSRLGEMYYGGWGVPRDYRKAMEWFKKSSHLSESQYFIGRMYDKGLGVEKDIKRAIEWWKRGADLNHAVCLFNLASCYESGDGVKKNIDKAIDYYEQSGALDYPEAVHNLSVIYFDNAYGRKDEAKAFEYAKQAHAMGYPKGTFLLACCYSNGVGVRTDQRKAEALAQQAALAGDRDAQEAIKQAGQQQMMSILGAAFQIGFGDGDVVSSQDQMDATYHQWKSENPNQFMR
jgi:TPR repeat protein/pSer/pThr/pTyr-binding forkhead associated (FHA) protein